MTIKRNTLREAIKIALCIGATTMMSMGAAYAQDATPAAGTPADTTKAKNLDTVTVTGSRVRRVETETASPVVVLDRKAIEATGKLTIGEIVNNLPSISGAPATTQVNNGGGTGAATAELRGLGTVRTLVLIDGHRPGIQPIDLNSIPLELVERIEVLTEGASTVYGSDAIGGVINFIMRKNYNGAQATTNYGVSGQGDAEREGFSVIGGQSGDHGNFTVGAEYNKFNELPQADRPYSQNSLHLGRSTGVTIGGSPYTTTGLIGVPTQYQTSSGPQGYQAGTGGKKGKFNCNGQNPGGYYQYVTRNAGTSGTALSNYHCIGSADYFNFAPYNLLLTPQERTNAFALGNFDINDNVSAFLQFYHQKQTANFQLAPEVFTPDNDLSIAANSYYNPFGTQMGLGGASLGGRLLSVGPRIVGTTTANDVIFFGFKGSFGQTWSWDLDFDYNHFSSFATNQNYINDASLAASVGPSFNNNGTIVCGTPGNIIANCTPINIFNLSDPTTVAGLKAAEESALFQSMAIQKELEFNANGDLFELPAGAVKLALGGDRIDDYEHNLVDPVAIADANGNCQIGGQLCAKPLAGGFSVNEGYAEALIPILKNVPAVYALNLDLGDRYSAYSAFGDTNNRKVAIEYRPIKDLLIRGSASDVFRAPEIGNVFGGAGPNSPSLSTDFCAGTYTVAQLNTLFSQHGNFCGTKSGTNEAQLIANANANPNGTATIPSTIKANQTTGVVEGSALAGTTLGPEKGHSFDFGLVYDPSWLPGLSTTLDYYRVLLSGEITTLPPQTVENTCLANDNSPLCGFVVRNPNGGINRFIQPSFNLGSLATDGFDFSARYRMDLHQWGTMSYSLDLTHIDHFNEDSDPSGSRPDIQYAGTFGPAHGNIAKWRGNANMTWTKGDLDIGWSTKWVGKVTVTACDVTACDPAGLVAGATGGNLNIGNYFDNDITAGYNIKAYNSRVDVGVQNVFDKAPPFFYQFGVNANTDVNTYDTIGRLFWGRFTVKF